MGKYKLKPCPWCGYVENDEVEFACLDLFASVDGCCTYGPDVSKLGKTDEQWKQDAVDAWNRRAGTGEKDKLSTELMAFFTVPGVPVPKARPFKTRWGVVTPSKTRNYERKVAILAKEAWGEKEPLLGPLKIRCHFYLPIPTSWSKKKKAMALAGDLWPITRPDGDNLEKSQWDSCQVPTKTDIKNGTMKAGIYKNDSQIVIWDGKKVYSDNPRAEVWIEEIQ